MPFPTLLTYDQLLLCFRTSLRTRTWRRLDHLDKALFKASLDYLRRGGRIVHGLLLMKLGRLMEQLTETRVQRIVKRGLARAAVLLSGIQNGLSGWLLELKEWLKDPAYVFWLGTG
jgi:hypothetical protein